MYLLVRHAAIKVQEGGEAPAFGRPTTVGEGITAVEYVPKPLGLAFSQTEIDTLGRAVNRGGAFFDDLRWKLLYVVPQGPASCHEAWAPSVDLPAEAIMAGIRLPAEVDKRPWTWGLRGGDRSKPPSSLPSCKAADLSNVADA